MAEKKPSSTGFEIVSEMTFHYVKSEFARTLHVDGFFGGVTPKGDGLSLGVFSERHPYPDSSLYRKNPHNDTLEEDLAKRQITRKGVIREIESTLVINLETARSLRQWLDEHIQRLETVESQRKKR